IADLQSPGAGDCIDLAAKDIAKNTGYFHVVVCDANGNKQCCSGSASTQKIDYCRPIALTGGSKGVGQLPTGSLQNVPLNPTSPPTAPPTPGPAAPATTARKPPAGLCGPGVGGGTHCSCTNYADCQILST